MSTQSIAQPVTHIIPPERQFKKIFPNLPAHQTTAADLELLSKVMMDPNTRAPVDGAKVPAMLTYLGQFFDHDVTHDTQTTLNVPADLTTIENKETSYFDLSNVYGANNEFLNAQGKFDIGRTLNGEDDLPRDPTTGLALIADIRDDENLVISQLQLAFFKHHNRIFSELQLTNASLPLTQLIDMTKRQVILHYQYIVVHDFLKPICGQYFDRLFDAQGTPVVHPAIEALGPSIPVEFTGALYRMGHSMVRDAYYVNADFDVFPIFAQQLPAPLTSPPDLRGKRPLPSFFTFDWSMFTPMPFSKGFQVAENFDYFITQSLYTLPILPGVIGGGSNILPLRNLLRGVTYGLPTGQELARALGIPESEILSVTNRNWVLQTLNTDLTTAADLIRLTELYGEQTPLFMYGLMDNHLNGYGDHLGVLPSLVIGNVILNLIRNSPVNIFAENFSPVAGVHGCVSNGVYRMAEFFTHALNLQPFTAADVLPHPEANFMDPLDNRIFKNALIGHKFQPLTTPGALPEVVVQPFAGMVIPKYGPTLEPFNTTQVEINVVASNAVRAGLDSYSCVAKFLVNKQIEAIATGLLAPGGPITAPKAVVLSGGVLPQKPASTFVPNPDQVIGQIIADAFGEIATMTKVEAISRLPTVLQEIEAAISFNGVPTPLF